MDQLSRVLSYGAYVVKAAMLDVVDALSTDATCDPFTRQIQATVNIYGYAVGVLLETAEIDDQHARMLLTLQTATPSLSIEGQRRVLGFLDNSVELLLENTFMGKKESYL